MKVRGFRALRPKREMAEKFSSPPYDVVRDLEVIEDIKNGKNLFYKVIKTDSLYEDNIYEKAKENLEKFKQEGILQKDEKKSFYVYQEIFGCINQTGLVVTIDIDEYIDGNIKRHEKTLMEKEVDRLNNFYNCRANTEPVFLFQEENLKLKEIIKCSKQEENKLYEFVSEDNVTHILYKIDDIQMVEKIEEIFQKTDKFYIADGHHRIASAIEVGKKMRKENPSYSKDEEFNYFMAVVFFEDELKILPYNRVIKDIENYDIENILINLQEKFEITKLEQISYPKKPHNFTMIVGKNIYNLKAKNYIVEEYNPVESLDTVILHKNIIEPFFDIRDIKNEDKIIFVGGSKAKDNLDKYREKNLIILMYPTQIQQIKNISDTDNIMPAKSTWFEPKLRSGLFIHEF